MLTSIIVPFFNMWSLTHSRMMELYKYAPQDCEILLMDDCSTENDCAGGIAFWQKAARHTVRYKRMEENQGFLKTSNYGMKIAKGDIKILLSNDVVMSGDFITPIQNILKEKPTALVGSRLIWWYSGWNAIIVQGKKMVMPYLEGWLLACTAKTWDELGGFDPRYAPYDYEDVDLSAAATKQGRELIPLNSPHLQHISGATISKVNPHRQEITENNKVKFQSKWSKLLEGT